MQPTCSDVCAGPDNSVKISLTNKIYEANQTLQYLYCDGANILANFDNCIDCLNKASDAQVLTQCKFRTRSMSWIEVLTEENLDVKTLKAACVQKPEVGQTVKLDFSLFPTATSRVSSNTAESDINTTSATSKPATPTSISPDLASSNLVASLQASFSAVAASESAAAALSKISSDNKLRTTVGVGVGIGVGGFFAISILVCVILTRYRSTRRRKVEEENARAHSETRHQANSIAKNQFMDCQQSELANDSNFVEVGGESHKPFMLDSGPIWEVPGDTSAVTTSTRTTMTAATAIHPTGHEFPRQENWT